MCICTAGLCRVSLCMHVLCDQKLACFRALPFENFLLSVIYNFFTELKCLQCGLLHPGSFTDWVIHGFPNKTQCFPNLEIIIFFCALSAHHTLYNTIAGASCSGTHCVLHSVSVLVLRQLHCYTCIQRHFRLSLRETTCRLESPCSAKQQQLQYMYRCMHAQCAQGMCSMELEY